MFRKTGIFGNVCQIFTIWQPWARISAAFYCQMMYRAYSQSNSRKTHPLANCNVTFLNLLRFRSPLLSIAAFPFTPLWMHGQYKNNPIQWCRRRACTGCKCAPKNFDLLKIWAKSLIIREKSLKICAKSLKILEKYGAQRCSTSKMASNICLRPFLVGHIKKMSSWCLWEKKICRQSHTKTFRACFGKFGQISFVPQKICLLQDLWS